VLGNAIRKVRFAGAIGGICYIDLRQAKEVRQRESIKIKITIMKRVKPSSF